MPWNPEYYTGSVATRFLVKRTQKPEPPENQKLINKLHNKWLKDNGYKQQATSNKPQAKKKRP